MEKQVLVISEKDVQDIIGERHIDLNREIEKALLITGQKKCILPDKISQIFDGSVQTRINCMPATLLEEKVSGMKWVSVFPTNSKKGIKNVSGAVLLSEIRTGKLLCLCSATVLTALRTAAVGAVAAKYLAPRKVDTIGFIGGGEEAKFHLIQIKKMFPQIRYCKIASRTSVSEKRFVEEMSACYPQITFLKCGSNFQNAVKGADIVVTATSSQEQLLQTDWIEPGMLYIHVGGVEDEYGVVKRADKIVCDDWEAVKHRAQTISRMYQEGYLEDKDIYANLCEIIQGERPGREDDKEFIYFDSVGLATIDIYLAYQIYQAAQKENIGKYVDLENVVHVDYSKYI